jgi:hypothetical protein
MLGHRITMPNKLKNHAEELKNHANKLKNHANKLKNHAGPPYYYAK